MATTNPRVRDFTTGERSLDVEVASGDAFEVLLSLYALGEESGDEDFEIGSEWFQGVKDRISKALMDQIEEVGDWSVWMSLVGEVYAMGAPHTMERFLEHLEQIDPVELRKGMLEVGSCYASEAVDPAELAAVAAGETGAIDRAEEWCEKCAGLLRLLELPPAETRDTLVGLLGSFWVQAAPVSEETVSVLERDADHKRSLARRMDPERLVEKATNGITVAVRTDLDGVVLVPSVVVRPWVLIAKRDGKQIFCYSVAEENLGVDPGAPPAWLVQFYKALGDERRLTILRRLAEGPASFGDLVELLALAKSTVHHHIRHLRSAGLVRVTMGEEKEYSLRTGSVPEAARLLEGFLGTEPKDG